MRERVTVEISLLLDNGDDAPRTDEVFVSDLCDALHGLSLDNGTEFSEVIEAEVRHIIDRGAS